MTALGIGLACLALAVGLFLAAVYCSWSWKQARVALRESESEK